MSPKEAVGIDSLTNFYRKLQMSSVESKQLAQPTPPKKIIESDETDDFFKSLGFKDPFHKNLGKNS